MQKPKIPNNKHQNSILSTNQDQKHARHLEKNIKVIASLTLTKVIVKGNPKRKKH